MNKVWYRGSIVASEEAVVSTSSVAARYGLTVFEGVRAYLSFDKQRLNIFRLRDHLHRLKASASFLEMDLGYEEEDVVDIVKEVLTANLFSQDCYIRIDAVPGEELSWHMVTKSDLVVRAIPIDGYTSSTTKTKRACISTWRKMDSNQMPASIKVGANYINSRLAHREALRNGYDLPILLNSRGNVAESSGSSIVMIDNHSLITPPQTAQVLSSITVRTLRQLATGLGINVLEREIDRVELSQSEEVFACGTAIEIAPIISIDGLPILNGEVGRLTKVLYDAWMAEARSNSSNFHWNDDFVLSPQVSS